MSKSSHVKWMWRNYINIILFFNCKSDGTFLHDESYSECIIHIFSRIYQFSLLKKRLNIQCRLVTNYCRYRCLLSKNSSRIPMTIFPRSVLISIRDLDVYFRFQVQYMKTYFKKNRLFYLPVFLCLKIHSIKFASSISKSAQYWKNISLISISTLYVVNNIWRRGP